MLPHQYTSEELNHVSLANFVLASFQNLESLEVPVARQDQIDWQYLHLVQTGTGFRGSLSASLPESPASKYDTPFLPATYFSLSNLLLLGDDLQRIEIPKVLQEIKALQNPDGSFSASRLTKESDLRYSYMAVAIRFILVRASIRNVAELPDIDVEATKKFIRSCLSMEGAYAQFPGAEAHAGLTFCALAALSLLDCEPMPTEQKRITEWLVSRHNTDGGMNGRVSKASDVCYCYWVFCCLHLLGQSEVLDSLLLASFVDTCQSRIGGYAKVPDEFPDIYHTYLGLAVRRFPDKKSRIACALSLPDHALGLLL